MLGSLFHGPAGVGEIDTAAGRAVVEERFSALRRQVPVIYLMAVTNLCGLELAIRGAIDVGINFPTILAVCALFRTAQWFRISADASHAVMLRRLRQTCWLAALLCVCICLWCLHLITYAETSTRMAVILFGGFTAIGAAYGLSALPIAARFPIFVLALPLAGMALVSRDSQFVGAAFSLALVAILILRLLSLHNAHLTDLIESRAKLVHEQELADEARREAIAAATTDFLTGLPNRRAFIAALDAEMDKSNDIFAVAILDLDNFKHINDTLGHPSGDRILEVVAARLSSAAGADMMVARLGGDEFGLLMRSVTRPAQARAVGKRILAQVVRVTIVSGRQVSVAGSMGIAVSRKGTSRTPSRILADADLALYEAKCSKGAQVAVFAPRMEMPHYRRAQIEGALRMRGVHEHIHPVFQPIFELESGRVVASEALARWNDKVLGDVPPSEFVPIAEQLNLIGNISDHLMGQAFSDAAGWPPSIRLSFNLSAVQLCSPGSAESIIKALRQAHLKNHQLQVEVTETALLADFCRARQNLARLRAAGVTIVLDDFGAGYASIGYLRQLRFDQIKLDGALIAAAQESADGKRLLSAVIGLCRALGVVTVAEHIENEEQYRLVVQLGCEAGQGFWLQRPMSAAESREFFRAGAMLTRQPRAPGDRTAA